VQPASLEAVAPQDPVEPPAPIQSQAAAARNNAEWCAAMCRSHDIPSTFGETIWSSSRRCPRYYPDAITLHPDAGAGDLLPRLDLSVPGCAVKDSFAVLDLTPHGFVEVFTAQWIRRPAGAPDPVPARTLRVEHVTAAAGLDLWCAAWSGGADDARDVFRPALLDEPEALVLGFHDDAGVVGGVVLNRSAAAVGLSNVFAADAADAADAVTVWASAITAATSRFPGLPLVGYEHGDDLGAALATGFTGLGPLRVWAHEA
jgi:hypothetical protein